MSCRDISTSRNGNDPLTSFPLVNFVLAFYIIDSVNLTSNTVTSIHSRQLKNKIQLETQKQDKSCQKIQDPKERERNQVGKEKV